MKYSFRAYFRYISLEAEAVVQLTILQLRGWKV